MSIKEKLKDQLNNPKIDTIEVTADDYNQILSDPATLCGPLKPEPPIKSKKHEVRYKKVRTGLFTWENKVSHEYEAIEYDYQDPKYLKALDAWMNACKKTNWILFCGKKVVLKDESKILL